jgi:hypothetical protein
MARKLFDKYALPAVLQARIERATAAVHALDRASFLQPTLAGVLEQIVADNALDVATISKPHSGKAGVSGFMDVAINYRGDGSTFDIYPSRSSISPWMCEVHDGQITVSVREGDGATQQRVDEFVRDTTSNLNLLRSEAAEGRIKLGEAVRAEGEKRRLKIIEEDKRDKGMSFPIQR